MKVVCIDNKGIEWLLTKGLQYDVLSTINEYYNVLIDGETHSLCMKRFKKIDEQQDNHYDNSNGSLYKFANDHDLNAWEFDIIKRITRCRKKGQFKEDLEKTKRVIDLYLKEYNDGK